MWLANRKELTVVSPDELMFGDTINSSPGHVKFWDIPTHAIRLYQRIHLYHHWKDTHTVTYVGDAHGRFDTPHLFEATFPLAKYTPFDEWYSPDDHTYNINRYADAIPNYEAETLFLEIFNEVEGSVYDVGELFDFLIQDILGYSLTYWGKWADFGERETVCSVVARTAQMKWYNDKLKENGHCRRPGGDIHVERTAPALFPDHDTYLHLIKLIANTA